eukprot:CAMPEP_0119316708 /NCGR_PEP_ID=MMETSP1333-20130426/40548_1 /TAXON_ID=418940 /ORGANISM="Scyphosphaera apsteinii, Strain RCC1455" /LENGTH=93 /DNA_ID=CAMNT_0007322421 /DNA_START=431 /DNA_END=712 /DNA_ORIENTATION=-
MPVTTRTPTRAGERKEPSGALAHACSAVSRTAFAAGSSLACVADGSSASCCAGSAILTAALIGRSTAGADCDAVAMKCGIEPGTSVLQRCRVA